MATLSRDEQLRRINQARLNHTGTYDNDTETEEERRRRIEQQALRPETREGATPLSATEQQARIAAARAQYGPDVTGLNNSPEMRQAAAEQAYRKVFEDEEAKRQEAFEAYRRAAADQLLQNTAKNGLGTIGQPNISPSFNQEDQLSLGARLRAQGKPASTIDAFTYGDGTGMTEEDWNGSIRNRNNLTKEQIDLAERYRIFTEANEKEGSRENPLAGEWLHDRLIETGLTEAQVEELAHNKTGRTVEEELSFASNTLGNLSKETQQDLLRYVQTREDDDAAIGSTMGDSTGFMASRAGIRLAESEQEREELKARIMKEAGIDEDTFNRYTQYADELYGYSENARMTEQLQNQVRTGSPLRDVLNAGAASLASVALSPVSGYQALGEALRSGSYADRNAPVNTYSRAYAAQNASQAMRQTTGERISEAAGGGALGDAAKFSYDVLMSVADNLTRAAIGRGVVGPLSEIGLSAEKIRAVAEATTLSAVGTSAFASTLQEAQNRGVSTENALQMAGIAGIAEIATELTPLDSFFDILERSGAQAAKHALQDVLKQTITEGSEEALSDVINDIADRIINKGHSEYEESVREYMDQGMSEKEAKNQARLDFVKEVGLDFAAGAAAGGLAGGAAIASSYVRDGQTAHALFDDRDFSDLAKQIDTDERHYENREDYEKALEAKSMTEDLAKKKEAGEEPTTKELRNLYRTIFGVDEEGNLTNEIRQRTPGTITAEEAPEQYQVKQTDISPDDAARAAGTATNAEELAAAYNDARLSTNEVTAAEAEDNLQMNAARLKATGAATQAEIDTAVEGFLELDKAPQIYADAYNQEEGVSRANLSPAMQTIWAEGLLAGEQARNGAAVDMEQAAGQKITFETVGDHADIRIDDRQMELQDAEIEDYGLDKLATFASHAPTVEAANAIMEHIPEGVPVNTYQTAFTRFYDAGAGGFRTYEEISDRNQALKNMIPEETLRTFYDLGQKELTEVSGIVPGTVKMGTGRVIDSRTDKSSDLPDLGLIEAVAQATGLDVEVTDQLEKHINGEFTKATSRVILNINDRTFQTLFHESIGEFAEAYNPEGMKEVQDAVLSYLSEKYDKWYGQDALNGLAGKYQEAYIQQEGAKSFRDAMNEMVNDTISGFFMDEKGMEDFAGWLDAKRPQEKKNILQKLADFIQGIVDSLTRLLNAGELSNTARSIYNMEQQRADEIRQRIFSVMDTAIENYRSQAGAESAQTGTESARNGTENAQNGSKNAQTGTKDAEVQTIEESLIEAASKAKEDGTAFSIEVPIEQDRDLLAIHNLQVEELAKQLQLGGLTSPSIAIIRAGMGHDMYGAATVLFRRGTIDPQVNRQNRVYGGDAWTPTFPGIEYLISDKVANKIQTMLESTLSEDVKKAAGYYMGRYYADNMESRINSYGNAVEAYESDLALKAAFLLEQGEDLTPTIKTETEERMTGYSEAEIRRFINVLQNRYGEGPLNRIQVWKAFGEIEENPLDAVKDMMREAGLDPAKLFDQEDTTGRQSAKAGRLLRDARDQYRGKEYGTKTSVDILELTNRIEEKTDTAAFKKWLEKQFEGLIVDSGLYNGKDKYTPSGSRRSWKSLHMPVTAENIVKLMNDQYAKGQDFGSPIAHFLAVSTKDFKNVDQIRQSEDQIRKISQEEYNALKDEIGKKVEALAFEIMDRSFGNQYDAMKNAEEVITEAAREGKRTVSGIQKVLNRYPDMHIKSDTAQRILDLMNEAAELPTGYFEAKPGRVVDFSEIATLILPDSAPISLIRQLDEMKIPYVTYEAGNEENRKEILNQKAEDLDTKFSLRVNQRNGKKGTGNGSKENRDTRRYSKISFKGLSESEIAEGKQYTMEYLEKQGDVTIADPADYDLDTKVFRTNGVSEVNQRAKNNTRKVHKQNGMDQLDDTVLYSSRYKLAITFNNDSIRHKKGKRNILDKNDAYVREILPLLVQNGVIVNEADGEEGYDTTYVMMAKYKARGNDETGSDVYNVARMIIYYDSKTGEAKLYSVLKGRKGSATRHDKSSEWRIEDPLTRASLTETIADFLLDVKEEFSEDLSKNVAEELNYIRKKGGVRNLRYSLSIDSDSVFADIMREDEERQRAERRQTSILEEGRKALKGQRVDMKRIREISQDIVTEYKSDMDPTKLAGYLRSVFGYIQSADTSDASMDFNDLAQLMDEVAAPVIAQAYKSTEEHSTQQILYKGFRKQLSSIEFSLTDEQKKEITGLYGNMTAFRKLFPELNIKDSAASNLDQIWTSEIVPAILGYQTSGTTQDDLLQADDTQQIGFLTQAIENAKPGKLDNLYGDANAQRQKAEELTLDILARYYRGFDEKGLTKTSTEALRLFRNEIAEARRQAYDEALEELKRESASTPGGLPASITRSTDQTIDAVRAEYNARVEAAKAEGQKEKDKALQEMRAYYEARIKRLQESKNDTTLKKLAEQRSRYVDNSRRMKERQETAEYQKRIRKNWSDLNNWLTAPTDKKHIPSSMREPIAEFLSTFDMITGRMDPEGTTATKWREKMASLTNFLSRLQREEGDTEADAQAFAVTLDPEISGMMSDFMERNKLVSRLSDLPAREMQALSQIMQALRTGVNNANTLYVNQRSKQVTDLAEETIAYTNSLKEGKTNQTRFEKTLKDLLNNVNLDPVTFFDELGEGASSIYQELRQGFDRRTRHIKEAQEFMEPVMQGKNVKTWTGSGAKIHTFDIGGKQLQLTTGQIMSLYELRKRKAANDHLTIGGIKAGEIRKGVRVISQIRAVNPTEEQYQMIIDTLTDEQKAVADAMQEFMAKNCSAWGNNTSMIMYGYEKFGELDYFPMKVDGNTIAATDKNIATALLHSIQNMGFTKQLQPFARNALVIDDIFDVFTNHVTQVATYDGFTMPIADALRWFNYKTTYRDDNGKSLGGSYQESVQQSLERLRGNAAKTYFKQLMLDINGTRNAANSTQVSDILLSNVKGAAVGANLRVAIQQPTAYLRAMAEMDPKYLLQAVPSFVEAKKLSDKAKDLSPLAYWKSMGYYETNIGQSMKQIITGITTARDKVRDISGTFAQLGDDLTWGVLWKAVEIETKDTTNLKPGTTEFDEHVAERFEYIVDRTQVVDTILHRSQIMRDTSGFSKLETAFMSEPTKSYNMLHRALVKSLRTGDGKPVIRAGATFLFTALLTSLAAALVDAFRNDDDETAWIERYTAALTENAIDNVNPLNMIPYAKDFVSVISGWSMSRTEMQGITDAVAAVKDIYKISTGQSTKTPYGVARATTKALSEMTGIPAYGAWREVEAIYNNFSPMNLQRNYSYDPLKSAVRSGKDPQDAISFAYKGGKDNDGIVKVIGNTFKSDYVDKYLNDPEAAEELRANITKVYVSIGKDDAWIEDKFKTWEKDAAKKAKEADAATGSAAPAETAAGAQEETEAEEEYVSDYQGVYDAINGSGDVAAAVKEMLASGKKEAGVKQALTRKYKQQMIDTYNRSVNEAQKLQTRLLQAYMTAGDTRDEALDRINKWISDSRK